MNIMAAATMAAQLLTDGDTAILRVDNRRPAHALEPGVAASATNCRFDQGKPRPRHGVALEGWGWREVGPITDDSALPSFSTASDALYQRAIVTGFTVGERYKYSAGETLFLTTVADWYTPAGVQIDPGAFTATQTSYYLWRALGLADATSARIYTRANTCAYARFNDPGTGTDNGILVTDEWRADEGRGRAWRILPGNDPQEIELNGQDVWDTARLVQCHNSMILLRHGNERHYFGAGNLTALTDVITLNGEPSWAVGTSERVRFELATDQAEIVGVIQNITDTDLAANTITVIGHGLTNGTAKYVSALSGATANAMYFLRSATVDTLTLHPTYADAVAGTATVNLTADNETGTLTDHNPAPGNYYYARRFASNVIKLYQDSANAAADTNWLTFTGALTSADRFFIERVANPEPFFGNGAPPLILQPTVDGVTAFENGFKPVTDNVAITDTNATSDIITAPNHRFVFGDSVTGTAITGVTYPSFAAPQSDHTLRLYATELEALADDGATGLRNLTVNSETGTIWKTGASALPMPPAREGMYFKGRLVLINGRDNIMLSDPHDYLHFTQWTGTVSANLGEAGSALWLAPLGDDALLIGKEQCVLILTGLGGASTGWAMDDVTREYGGTASLAAVNVGTDLWMLSRKGVASIIRTVAGETQGVARTVSHSIPEDLADVDWVYAHQACAATWDNRFFLALPGKNQTDVVNNRVLVCNLINGGLRVEQAVMAGDLVGGVVESGGRVDSWEGTWTGDLLVPYAFARLSVFGEERLTFATPDGLVCWLHDGWDDDGAEIETSLTTRGYFGGREVLALKGSLQLETFRPSYSVSVKTAGHNESTAIITDQTNDPTAYLTYGTAAYVPASSTSATFSAAHREDYSPTVDELLTAELDIHQNITESLPMRERDRSPALVITNTQGSLRVVTVSISAMPVGIQASRKT